MRSLRWLYLSCFVVTAGGCTFHAWGAWLAEEPLTAQAPRSPGNVWLAQGDLTSFVATTVAAFAFSGTHALGHLGLSRGLGFLSISFLGSLSFELLGVTTGLVFGSYHYTDRLGCHVLGCVPLIIPVAWFMMMYLAYSFAEVLVRSLPGGTGRGRDSQGIFRNGLKATVAAVALVAWDLALDPVALGCAFWVWPQGGAYFGVPLHNFAGWLGTSLTLYLLFQWYERRFGRPSPVSQTSGVTDLPALAYVLVLVATASVAVALGYCEAALVSLLVTGGLFLGALTWRFCGGVNKRRFLTAAVPGPSHSPRDRRYRASRTRPVLVITP